MTDQWGDRLKELAESGDMDGLEEAWLSALEKPGRIDCFFEALDGLDEKTRNEQILNLMPLVLEVYEKMDKHAEVIRAGRAIGMLKPRDPGIRRALIKHLRKEHKGEEWIEFFLRESGLIEGLALNEAIIKYDSFLHYKPGAGVLHGSGWGPGVVEGYNEITRDLKVRFEDGSRRELPLSSAVDSLKPLAPEDMRIMLMNEPEALTQMAEDTPSSAIRKVLEIHRKGEKLTAARIKEALIDVVVPKAKWTKWWTRAKQAAAKDPYLEVTGGSRPAFQLRDKPMSIEEEAMAQLNLTKDLPEAVAKVREYFVSKPSDELKALLLDEVVKRSQNQIEQDGDPGEILDAILLIEEKRGKFPQDSAEYLKDTLMPEDEPPTPDESSEFIRSIPSEKGRSLVLKTYLKAFPEIWQELLCKGFFTIPNNLCDPVADLLIKNKHGELLVTKFRELSHKPWQAPWSLFYIARKVITGGFKNVADPPGHSEVALAMLLVLESSLFHTSGTVQTRRELVKRYEELFFDPKRHLLETFVQEASKEDIARAFSMIHMTSPVPEEVQEYLRSEISYKYPEYKTEEGAPYWEAGGIFCSRAGIRARQEELRILMEEKIPENSKAIGKAASLGDLSENAEWTAALEDQRLLTEKAAQMEDELDVARAIEDEGIPDGIIAPGIRVFFKRGDGGEEESISILGPWDAGKTPGVVSYMAPMAQPFLGKKEGDTVTVDLPGNSFEATVVRFERIELEW